MSLDTLPCKIQTDTSTLIWCSLLNFCLRLLEEFGLQFLRCFNVLDSSSWEAVLIQFTTVEAILLLLLLILLLIPNNYYWPYHANRFLEAVSDYLNGC